MMAQDLVFSPRESRDLSLLHLEALANQDKTRIMPYGVPSLDGYLGGLKPGDLTVVLARPSNGKTQLLLHLARQAAMRARQHGNREVLGPPVFVSHETDIESLYLRNVSAASGVSSFLLHNGEIEDWGRIVAAVDAVYNQTPIVYVGHSVHSGAKRPRMTLESVRESIFQAIDRFKIHPALVCFDYLQLMRLDRTTRDRRLDISEIVYGLKDMALELRVPVVLASQAGRQVDEKELPVPDLSSGKETGAIEEAADVVLGLMRPARYFQVGDDVPGSALGLTVTDELFFVRVLKHRNGPVGSGFWMHFNMATGELRDIEIRVVDLNPEE